MVGWLKKFGQAVLAGGAIATAFIPGGSVLAPMVAAMIPGSKDDKYIAKGLDVLGGIGEIIKNIEVAGQALNLSGADKLKGVIPSISNAVMLSAIMGGVPPGDKAMYDEGVKELTNGLVKIMNSRGD